MGKKTSCAVNEHSCMFSLTFESKKIMVQFGLRNVPEITNEILLQTHNTALVLQWIPLTDLNSVFILSGFL